MRRILLGALALAAWTATSAMGQDSTTSMNSNPAEMGPHVETLTFCKAVEERQAVDADTTFAADTERVYCLTQIGGVEGESTVTHVWYHDEEEMARVELPVRSASWTTWSSKKLLPAWSGTWRVDVLDASGNVLRSETFTLATTP